MAVAIAATAGSEASGWEVTGRKKRQGWRGCVTTGGNPVCLPKWYFNLSCRLQPRFFSPGSFQAFFTSWNWAWDVKTTLTLARGAATGEVTGLLKKFPPSTSHCLRSDQRHITLDIHNKQTRRPNSPNVSLCRTDEVTVSCRGRIWWQSQRLWKSNTYLKEFCLRA